jgi:hypothetical protein
MFCKTRCIVRSIANWGNQQETIKQVFRHMRATAAITFDKPRYIKNLNQLRDHNADLRCLHSQIRQLEASTSAISATLASSATLTTSSSPKIIPKEFEAIRRASQELQVVFQTAWECENKEHRLHDVKILVDAQLTEGVQLDLALSCNRGELYVQLL